MLWGSLHAWQRPWQGHCILKRWTLTALLGSVYAPFTKDFCTTPLQSSDFLWHGTYTHFPSFLLVLRIHNFPNYRLFNCHKPLITTGLSFKLSLASFIWIVSLIISLYKPPWKRGSGRLWSKYPPRTNPTRLQILPAFEIRVSDTSNTG